MAFATEPPPIVHLTENCPSGSMACVSMSVSVEHLEWVLVSKSEQDSAGYTTFVVRARGRIGGQRTTNHLVRIRGYTDGIACTSFGQSNVAVLGVSPSGPIRLLSDQGEFLLEPDSLSIGCADCVYDPASEEFFRSPSWDLALTDHRPEQLFLTTSGVLGIEYAEHCIVFADPLVRVGLPKCESMKTTRQLRIEAGGCT